MKLDDIYDKDGQDGVDNAREYNRLPTTVKYFIQSQQMLLMSKIKAKVKEIYGESGLKDLRKTSGYRSHATNSRHGGKVDSLHLWGCAVDIALDGIFKDLPIPTCCNVECLKEKDHWHIQFKRP